MTREEAIKILADLTDNLFLHTWEEQYKALHMAIEALTYKNLKKPNNTCEVDLISRQAAIDALDVLCQEHRYKIPGKIETYSQYNEAWQDALDRAEGAIFNLPSAQPEVIRCKDCIYYDPPHVKNNGVRYEYDEMPADAFDALGTGLVSAEYGVNIGGRCCVDYYWQNYSDDKRVFVREDNYCGRAERRTDE